MRCIYCDRDSKYKDRESGHCPSCHKPFAFEPRRGAPITDVAFKRAIDAVSADGHVRWGVEHLYYDVCRRIARARHRKPQLRIIFGALTVIVLGAVVKGVWSVAIAFGVAWIVIGIMAFKPRRRTVPLSRKDFDDMWARWQQVHPDRPKGMIVRQPPKPRTRPVEADVPLYSFDRAVICDRARTVDLLLANNFHFENNCAVLSIEGYPPGPFGTVRTMLKRNPRLQVFALHDATPAGCRLAHRLATDPEWFAGQAHVVDVGLRPAQARGFRGVLLPAHRTPVEPGQGIDVSEAKWLSVYALELAAIRPEQVLKRLYRAVNKRATPDGDGGSAEGGGGSSGSRDAAVASMAAHEGAFGGAGAQSGWGDGVSVDSDSFSSDAGDADGDGDGSG